MVLEPEESAIVRRTRVFLAVVAAALSLAASGSAQEGTGRPETVMRAGTTIPAGDNDGRNVGNTPSEAHRSLDHRPGVGTAVSS